MTGQTLATCSRRKILAMTGAAGLSVAGLHRRSASAQVAPAWKQLPSDGPAARWDHHLGGDESGIGLVLFGGRDGAGNALGDTWMYDIKAREWTPVESDAPAPRFGAAVASDPEGDRLILFGGQAGSDFFNDTWAFDFRGRTWTQLESGSAAPAPRYGMPGAIDGNGAFVISHGFTFDGRFDDTWSFDSDTATWTNVTPESTRPLNRCLHEMVWDAASEAFVLFGGCSSGFGPCPQGDLWDLAGGTWTDVTPASGPTPRTNPSMIYDDRNERVLLVAGSTADGVVNDVWSGRLGSDGFAWEQLIAEGEAPSPRSSHDMALVRGDVYLFGGTGPNGVTADLWKLSLT